MGFPKETNIEKIKEILKTFVNIRPIKTNEMFVYHPFLETRFVFDNNKEMVDVFEKEEYFNDFKKIAYRNIDKSSTLSQMLLHVTKPFKLTIFKHIREYLNEKDYSELLKDCWIMEEFTSRNPNVTKREMVSYFKKAKKEYIMDKEELQIYNNLPDEVTIYRGVRNKKGLYELSWTLSEDVAKWFALRFDSEEQIVFEVTIPKHEILTYISDRDEEEVIINPYNLKNYKIKERPM